MRPSYLRFMAEQTSDRIVDLLSQHQHLFPHQPLLQALAAVGEKSGFCPKAAEQAIQTLQINTGLSIGRLQRSQLVQLGRTIHRFWRQNVVEASRQSQPA